MLTLAFDSVSHTVGKRTGQTHLSFAGAWCSSISCCHVCSVRRLAEEYGSAVFEPTPLFVVLEGNTGNSEFLQTPTKGIYLWLRNYAGMQDYLGGMTGAEHQVCPWSDTAAKQRTRLLALTPSKVGSFVET